MTDLPVARRPLAEFAQSVLAVRWLALAALIALEAVEPPRTSIEAALPLYVGILVYSLGLTLFAWRFPARADATSRVAVPFDLAAVLAGMQFSAHPREFFVLGFVVCAMTGVAVGRAAAVLVAAAVALIQIPGLPASLFDPGRYLSWGVAALGLLFTSSAAAVVAAHRGSQQGAVLSDAIAQLAEGQQEVGRVLARDPAVLWPVLLDVARTVTAAQFAVLALEREDTGTMEIVSARGIEAPAANRLLPDLMTASTQGEVHPVNGQGSIPSAVCVPLRVQERTIGAIALGGSRDDGALPKALLSGVAAHVAAAVQTARTAYRIADIGVIEERRRIAREMHDGLAQTLADALLQTDLSGMAAQSNPGQIAADLKELRTILERAMRELREFMTDLRRQQQDSGLRAALESLGKEFERRNAIPVRLVCAGDDAQLPSGVRHAILAIARQALTNVQAHAHATAVTIRMEITEQGCAASITDDGVGFDLVAHRSRPPAAHHLGLTSLEERAALVGGRLQIDTAPGRGTTISVTVPLGRGDA